MSKKIFISQPMRDKTNEQIEVEREVITKSLSEMFDDFEVIDTFFKDAPHEAKPLWYLAKSIEMLADADYIIFAPGWENARGCVIEHMCAVSYGVTILEY